MILTNCNVYLAAPNSNARKSPKRVIETVWYESLKTNRMVLTDHWISKLIGTKLEHTLPDDEKNKILEELFRTYGHIWHLIWIFHTIFVFVFICLSAAAVMIGFSSTQSPLRTIKAIGKKNVKSMDVIFEEIGEEENETKSLWVKAWKLPLNKRIRLSRQSSIFGVNLELFEENAQFEKSIFS